MKNTTKLCHWGERSKCRLTGGSSTGRIKNRDLHVNNDFMFFSHTGWKRQSQRVCTKFRLINKPRDSPTTPEICVWCERENNRVNREPKCNFKCLLGERFMVGLELSVYVEADEHVGRLIETSNVRQRAKWKAKLFFIRKSENNKSRIYCFRNRCGQLCLGTSELVRRSGASR